jgi:hypothetical protein
MRILIIALPRTGSTSLLEKYAREFKLRSLFEPYDGSDRYIYKPNLNDIVVKTMIYHTPYGYSDIINGYVELSKEFDRVILLTRKNLNECAESWAYLRHNMSNQFHSQKHYVWKLPSNIEKHMEDIENWHKQLLEISKILNIEITYYEDIFDINAKERYRKNISIDKNKLI